MVHRKIRKRGKERHLSFFFHRSRESVCVPFICKNMKYIWNSVELFYPWKRVKIPRWSTHIKTLLGPGFGADVKEIHSRTVRKVYGGILSQEQRTCKAAHQWDPLDGKEQDVEEIWFRHTEHSSQLNADFHILHSKLSIPRNTQVSWENKNWESVHKWVKCTYLIITALSHLE